ncbi:MAG: CDP-alcohol phosphatidyltransferase family protein [Pseudomonadota bacterium]
MDGALARWLDARTVIGGYLDPIADRRCSSVCISRWAPRA